MSRNEAVFLNSVVTSLFVLCTFNIYPILYKDKSKKKLKNDLFLHISAVLKKMTK